MYSFSSAMLFTLSTQLLLSIIPPLHNMAVDLTVTLMPSHSTEQFIATINKQAERRVPKRRRGGARRSNCYDHQDLLQNVESGKKNCSSKPESVFNKLV